ncbi:tRNA nucleotidyltransferase/poly(A) polymerase [Desulfuromonas soudanensis]|uniref:tRNA nucleotidyltransferase/poly(A) polymerase n=1 Tax=Desulfuromonas soudanensis TaxID=1603606 RepID=A0A0M3QFP9_9BACT|nr:CCA tRNA nucleotidyltransferase [Desulfuromonas soudanensis]ALC16609.1 tRNA nucleotidyltransferase/poly(A) polymerase [Desulfuromonas soudanensis]
MKNLIDILTAAAVLPQMPQLLEPGQPCYLVGGALRDWLQGRRSTDFDFATPGDPSPLARRFAAGVKGTWFSLDRSRQQSRVVATVAGQSLTYDFAPFRAADLGGDLERRDFTVNAMACSIDGEPRLIDPCGGKRDLQAGLLRACSDRCFDDDPLRVLRGVRHGVTLGLEIEKGTRALMEAKAYLASRPAPERIRGELAAIFSAPSIARGLSLLQDLHLLPVLFGPSRAEGGTSCGISLALRCEELVRRGDGGEEGRELFNPMEEILFDGFSRWGVLKLAAFLRGYDPTDLARILEERLRLCRSHQRLVRSLVELDPGVGSEWPQLPRSPRGRALWVAGLGPSPRLALLLLSALVEPPPFTPGEGAALLRDLATVMVAGRIPDLVDGRWLCRELGLSPGPEVGRALGILRQAEIEGTVETPEQARNLLISRKNKNIDKEEDIFL